MRVSTHLFETARAESTDGQRLAIRVPETHEAADLHRLIAANVERGHLLPRSFADLTAHASRFLVVTERLETGGQGPGARGRELQASDEQIIACAELAPLSRNVAEIRSLVVVEGRRGIGLGTRLLMAMVEKGRRAGFPSLCAFTHDPRPFVKRGFSIVPHIWLPEKIATDCHTCVWFRRCQQYAMLLDLRAEDRGPGAGDLGLRARGNPTAAGTACNGDRPAMARASDGSGFDAAASPAVGS